MGVVENIESSDFYHKIQDRVQQDCLIENIYSIRQSYVDIFIVLIILQIFQKQNLSFFWICQKSFYDRSR